MPKRNNSGETPQQFPAKVPWRTAWFEKPWVRADALGPLGDRPLVFADGVWDGLHASGLQWLRGAAEWGTAAAGPRSALVACVYADLACDEHGLEQPIGSEVERLATVSALPFVDGVAILSDLRALEAFLRLRKALGRVRGWESLYGPLRADSVPDLVALPKGELTADEFWRRAMGRLRLAGDRR